MKSIATTALAGLMLLGTISAIASSNSSNAGMGFSDGGPAPLCRPTDPGCPPVIPNAKAKAVSFSDGGPAPLCRPTDPGCPPVIPNLR
jgi:hypothetical protein